MAHIDTRSVTVLCIRIPGYTAMCAGTSSARVAELLSIVYRDIAEVVQRHAGTITNHTGGQIIVLWNASYEQDDHALVAVQGAVNVLAHSDGINVLLHERNLPPIRMALGIQTGEATVGERGSAHFDAVGDTVNLAILLSESAGGGDILIGEDTATGITGRVQLEEAGLIQLTRGRQPIRAFRVLRAT